MRAHVIKYLYIGEWRQKMITFNEIKANEEIKTYIRAADESLESLQFTEHSFAHVVRTADVAGSILTKLGYDERTVELGKIAAYTI